MWYGLALAAAVTAADAWLEKPVDENTFRTYLEFFAVDSALPLDVEVSETQVEEGVEREHLTFQSSRGEHVPAFFFATPPTTGDRDPASSSYTAAVCEARIRQAFNSLPRCSFGLAGTYSPPT